MPTRRRGTRWRRRGVFANVEQRHGLAVAGDDRGRFRVRCLDGPGGVQPFDLRVRAADDLFLPPRSLPNQARTSWASASASSPVGLAARRVASVRTDSLSAAPAGSARVNARRSESPRAGRVLMACPSCWFVVWFSRLAPGYRRQPPSPQTSNQFRRRFAQDLDQPVKPFAIKLSADRAFADGPLRGSWRRNGETPEAAPAPARAV